MMYVNVLCFIASLNELGKRDKMRGLRAFYLFVDEFNKSNNTKARTLDSFYHMTY